MFVRELPKKFNNFKSTTLLKFKDLKWTALSKFKLDNILTISLIVIFLTANFVFFKAFYSFIHSVNPTQLVGWISSGYDKLHGVVQTAIVDSGTSNKNVSSETTVNGTLTKDNLIFPSWLSAIIVICNLIFVVGLGIITFLKDKFAFINKIYQYFVKKDSIQGIEEAIDGLIEKTNDLGAELTDLLQKNTEVIKAAKTLQASEELKTDDLYPTKLITDREIGGLVWDFHKDLDVTRFSLIRNFKILTNLKLDMMKKQVMYTERYLTTSVAQYQDIISGYLASKESSTVEISEFHNNAVAILDEKAKHIESLRVPLKKTSSQIDSIHQYFNKRLDIASTDESEIRGETIEPESFMARTFISKIKGYSAANTDLVVLEKNYRTRIDQLDKQLLDIGFGEFELSEGSLMRREENCVDTGFAEFEVSKGSLMRREENYVDTGFGEFEVSRGSTIKRKENYVSDNFGNEHEYEIDKSCELIEDTDELDISKIDTSTVKQEFRETYKNTENFLGFKSSMEQQLDNSITSNFFL